MSLMEVLSVIIPFIAGGGLVQIFNMKSTHKKAEAEAKGVELDNSAKIVEKYDKLTDDIRQEKADALALLDKERNSYESKLRDKDRQIKDKDAIITERWKDISLKRDTIDKLKDIISEKNEDISKLKVQLVESEYNKCIVIGCKERQPKRDIDKIN